MKSQLKILTVVLVASLIAGMISILLMATHFIMMSFSSALIFRQMGTWSLLVSISSISFWVLGSGVGGLTYYLSSFQEEKFDFPLKLWRYTSGIVAIDFFFVLAFFLQHQAFS